MIENLPTVDQLLANPAFVLGLTLVIVLAYHYVAQIPYREFVVLTQVKHRLFAALAPIAAQRGLRLVTTKQYREDDEYLVTLDRPVRAVALAIRDAGFDQHLIAGSIRRETPEGRQWAHTHWAAQHRDGTQTEAWVFPNHDGTTDVYAHREESVFDPDGHLSEPYTPGDPAGALDPVLDE